MIKARVAHVTTVAEGVKELGLLPESAPCPIWEPGAHIDVVLPSGTVRQYSLCGPVEDDRELRIAVQLETEGRGGSVEVHRRLSPGTIVEISAPRNHFRLRDHERYEFIAGGIGVTPMLAMIASVSAAGHPWRLWFGARTRARMAFVEQLQGFSGGEVVLSPENEAGRGDFSWLGELDATTGIYACGPPGLLEAVQQAAAAGAASVVFERFTAAPPTPSIASDSGYVVQLGPGGPSATVGPGQSMLDAVLRLGAEVDYSCEEGICGTCVTQVLEGEPDHRDSLLTEAERAQGQVLICVSGSCSPRLVLDLSPRT